MVVQEFNTLEDFSEVDEKQFKEYDRIVINNVSLLPTETMEDSQYVAFIKDLGKFIVISNKTYEETYNEWKRTRFKQENS